MVDGLKKLAKSDPLVVVTTEETGEHIIAGCGELHVEICINDLRKEFTNIEIIESEPIVTYKETVEATSSQICMSKSPNKHNRLYCTAAPLNSDLTDRLELGTGVSSKDDVKEKAKILSEEYEWDKSEALKIWSYGPENTGPNLLVDVTKGV